MRLVSASSTGSDRRCLLARASSPPASSLDLVQDTFEKIHFHHFVGHHRFSWLTSFSSAATRELCRSDSRTPSLDFAICTAADDRALGADDSEGRAFRASKRLVIQSTHAVPAALTPGEFRGAPHRDCWPSSPGRRGSWLSFFASPVRDVPLPWFH